MARERSDHTLQATELVDELVVRISESETLKFDNRYEFFAYAAKVMRHGLVDHARRRAALKHGGGFVRVPLAELDDSPGAAAPASAELLTLDASLARLEEVRPEAARIFELRHFAGLSQEELVRVTGLSLATVKRRLQLADRWVGADLGVSANGAAGP